MITVSWLWMNEEPHDGFWDWGLIKELFRKSDYEFKHQHGNVIAPASFGIVVVPGGAQVKHIDRINRQLAKLQSCIVIVTSDEERLFPIEKLNHPNMKLWLGYGRPGDEADVFLPLGAPDGFQPVISDDKTLDWYFAGQDTTPTRHELVSALEKLEGGLLFTTDGFAKGDKQQYVINMGRTKVAPAPHGVAHPDSFRLYEALESGAFPVVGEDEYWDMINFPLVSLTGWDDFSRLTYTLAATNYLAYEWQRYKRMLRRILDSDIEELSGISHTPKPITVLIPTSPIPSHPDTSIIEETIKSVRDRLPDAEIIVMADGVREEQESLRGNYEYYQQRLFRLSRKYDFIVKRFEEHLHQAAITAFTLTYVDSPLILFVEHDTPLEGEIPFDDISKVILNDKLDVVRFHFESEILPDHKHLTRDSFMHEGIPYTRTVQWSQRPHLASNEYYLRIIHDHFASGENPIKIKKDFIEDVMHGIVQSSEDDPEQWGVHRLAFYRPPGNMRRSYHTDGRGNESKFDTGGE